MYLSRHATTEGARWALDGCYLPAAFTLDLPLQLPAGDFQRFLEGLPRGEAAEGVLLPPVEPAQEVWASGVTYERSREARMFESRERSEEHTSELQSRQYLVCRLLLEKKKTLS